MCPLIANTCAVLFIIETVFMALNGIRREVSLVNHLLNQKRTSSQYRLLAAVCAKARVAHFIWQRHEHMLSCRCNRTCISSETYRPVLVRRL